MEWFLLTAPIPGPVELGLGLRAALSAFLLAVVPLLYLVLRNLLTSRAAEADTAWVDEDRADVTRRAA